MINTEYREAIAQVLDILNYTNKEDVEKIPKKFINFLEENASETYETNLDHSKPIEEMNLKPKTQAILGLIYMRYWADEQGKEEFKKKIKDNEIKYQENAREKYNPDNIFAKEDIKVTEETQMIVTQKETLWEKIINKIKKIFRR